MCRAYGAGGIGEAGEEAVRQRPLPRPTGPLSGIRGGHASTSQVGEATPRGRSPACGQRQSSVPATSWGFFPLQVDGDSKKDKQQEGERDHDHYPAYDYVRSAPTPSKTSFVMP